eukprot:UN05788
MDVFLFVLLVSFLLGTISFIPNFYEEITVEILGMKPLHMTDSVSIQRIYTTCVFYKILLFCLLSP